MSADPEEEDVLMAEFEQSFDISPLRPSLEEMVAMDVEADLQEVSKPLEKAPITAQEIEDIFTKSEFLQAEGFMFRKIGDRLWQLTANNNSYQVTFDPKIFAENPSLRLMNFGEPLFEKMLEMMARGTGW